MIQIVLRIYFNVPWPTSTKSHENLLIILELSCSQAKIKTDVKLQVLNSDFETLYVQINLTWLW